MNTAENKNKKPQVETREGGACAHAGGCPVCMCARVCDDRGVVKL